MKTLLNKRQLIARSVIYLFMIGISLAIIMHISKVTDHFILHPRPYTQLTIETPIISPFNETYLHLRTDLLKNEPLLYQNIQKKILLWHSMQAVIHLILILLMLFQIRKVLQQIPCSTFFTPINQHILQNFGTLLGIWVFVDFVLYQSFQLFIPMSLVKDNFNYLPLNSSPLLGLLFSINFSLLIAAIAFFVVSYAFKDGLQLRKQADLTI